MNKPLVGIMYNPIPILEWDYKCGSNLLLSWANIFVDLKCCISVSLQALVGL